MRQRDSPMGKGFSGGPVNNRTPGSPSRPSRIQEKLSYEAAHFEQPIENQTPRPGEQAADTRRLLWKGLGGGVRAKHRRQQSAKKYTRNRAIYIREKARQRDIFQGEVRSRAQKAQKADNKKPDLKGPKRGKKIPEEKLLKQGWGLTPF